MSSLAYFLHLLISNRDYENSGVALPVLTGVERWNVNIDTYKFRGDKKESKYF